jgi:hypothetical protein
VIISGVNDHPAAGKGTAGSLRDATEFTGRESATTWVRSYPVLAR